MVKRRISISLSDESLKKLEEQAQNMGISKSAYITTLIHEKEKE